MQAQSIASKRLSCMEPPGVSGLSFLLHVSLATGTGVRASHSAMPVGAKVTVSKEKPGSYIDLVDLILIIDKR